MQEFYKKCKLLLPNSQKYAIISFVEVTSEKEGSVVKRLRHRPFTAVTRVRFPSESVGWKFLKIIYGVIAKW